MKTKIVKHIASEAMDALLNAQADATNMRDKYPDMLSDTRTAGPGLDFAVLREHLDTAAKRLELLL